MAFENLTDPIGSPQPQQNFNGVQGNSYDSQPARIPAPQVPMAPAGPRPVPQAPDVPNAFDDDDAVGKISTAWFAHMLTRNSGQPAAPQNPTQTGGSFAQKLQSAINNVGASFGDSAAATKDLPQGVGGIGGVTRTLAARGERMTAQHDKDFEQQMATSREAREEEQMRQQTALNNVSMAVHQRQLDNENEAAQNRVFTSNQTASKAREDQGFQVEHGVTEAELTRRMNDFKGGPDGEKHFGDMFDAIPVGKITVNGQPTTTYDIVARNGEPVKVTQEESDFIRQHGGPNLPAGTQMSNVDLTSARLKAQRVATAQHQIEEATQRDLDDNQKKLLNRDLATPAVQHALSLHPEDRIAGITEGLQAAQGHVQHGQQLVAAAQAHGDPAAIDEAKQYLESAQQEQQSLQNVAGFAFTKEDYESHEKARHDKEEESIKRQEVAQKNHDAIVSGLTGDDYLQTLPVSQQSIVRAVGEGRQKLPANRKEALALLEQVHQAYPDFDESKVGTWQKANNEYRGSGKTATQIVPAYNTALAHMQDLYNNTTGEGIFNPMSKAYQDREVALGYVSREVGKAVSAGAMTQKEGEELLGTLKGGLTPALKRERIAKTAQLLHDKIDEYQTKFNESAPSSAVKVPMLISPKAAASYDYIQSGGQAQQPHTQQPQLPPQAVQQLKEGQHTTFANGQTWTLQNGQPVQITGAK